MHQHHSLMLSFQLYLSVSRTGKDKMGITRNESDRLLMALERLLSIEELELKPTLEKAATLLAQALEADKIDVFWYEPETACLVAVGVSNTPMGRRQRALGLDRLPLANGGRSVKVYQTDSSFVTGQADKDPEELAGIIDGLGVRSQVICPLKVAGTLRGAFQACSAKPEHYTQEDLPFSEAVTRWVGMVAHRAELVEQVRLHAVEQGRREAINELINLLSPRQRQVAALVAAGMTNVEISRALVITQGTAANHVRNILLKFDAPNRARIAAIMAEHGIQLPGSDGSVPE
jgi:DNA-binding CsgD family transcriptional regulator